MGTAKSGPAVTVAHPNMLLKTQQANQVIRVARAILPLHIPEKASKGKDESKAISIASLLCAIPLGRPSCMATNTEGRHEIVKDSVTTLKGNKYANLIAGAKGP